MKPLHLLLLACVACSHQERPSQELPNPLVQTAAERELDRTSKSWEWLVSSSLLNGSSRQDSVEASDKLVSVLFDVDVTANTSWFDRPQLSEFDLAYLDGKVDLQRKDEIKRLLEWRIAYNFRSVAEH